MCSIERQYYINGAHVQQLITKNQIDPITKKNIDIMIIYIYTYMTLYNTKPHSVTSWWLHHPFEIYARQNGNLPQAGLKNKIISKTTT